jgi:PhnB protein
MAKQERSVPEGLYTVTPSLIVDGAADLIEFLKRVFDASEIMRLTFPDGLVMHAQLRIGDSIIMIADAHGGRRPVPGALYVHVKDPDATYERAMHAGATSLMPPADQFYGDRMGCIQDAAGNIWMVAKHIEDVTPEEMKRRADKLMCEHRESAGARE